jgi:RNA polymerase sigma factor (sigma-70 family)
MGTSKSHGFDPGIILWLDGAGRFPRLSTERISQIANEIQSLPKDSAKRKRLVEKLVKHNLLLAANFVKRFMNSKSHNKWGSSETLDYLQVAAIGLVRAAEKFDPKRGYTFATYATHWMHSTVGRYNLKTMSLVHVTEAAARKYLYYKKNGRMSAPGGSREAKASEVRSLESLLKNAYNCLSLDASFTEDGSPLMESVATPVKQSLGWRHIYSSLRRVGITPIEIQILRDYYVNNKTIAEIADRMALPVQQVCQYKRHAIAATGRRASDIPW